MSAGRVFSGPFAGMGYVASSVGSAWHPKVLGTYEVELHKQISSFSDKTFDAFLDIGAAEGYYAIGMTRVIKCKSVVAYEATTEGQCLIQQLAELNKVTSKVAVRGFCTPEEFKKVVHEHPGTLLVICDIEGGEVGLLLGIPAELLSNAYLIVETHEFIVPGVTDKLKQHFFKTHHIEHIRSTPRGRSDIPKDFRSPVWDRWTVRMMEEFRPAVMDWLIMRPCAESGSH